MYWNSDSQFLWYLVYFQSSIRQFLFSSIVKIIYFKYIIKWICMQVHVVVFRMVYSVEYNLSVEQPFYLAISLATKCSMLCESFEQKLKKNFVFIWNGEKINRGGCRTPVWHSFCKKTLNGNGGMMNRIATMYRRQAKQKKVRVISGNLILILHFLYAGNIAFDVLGKIIKINSHDLSMIVI